MQIDAGDMWYGNAIGFFDSFRSAREGSRKIGQKTTKVQMIKSSLRPKPYTKNRFSCNFAKLFFGEYVIEEKRLSRFDLIRRQQIDP